MKPLEMVRPKYRRLRSLTPSVGLAMAAFLVLATTCNASVHRGEIAFIEPITPPALGGPAVPITERTEYDHRVGVMYDDQNGSLTLSVELFAPEHWGPSLGPVHFTAGPTCTDEELTGTFSTEPDVEEQIEANSGYPPTGIPPLRGTASIRGFEGSATSTGSYANREFVITFHDPGLVDRQWRCIRINEEDEIHTDNWPLPPSPAPILKDYAAVFHAYYFGPSVAVCAHLTNHAQRVFQGHTKSCTAAATQIRRELRSHIQPHAWRQMQSRLVASVRVLSISATRATTVETLGDPPAHISLVYSPGGWLFTSNAPLV
jgi:hypothetical protein